MDAVRQVVIHDKGPWLDPRSLERPVSQAAVGCAALSLIFQGYGLLQVFAGQGTRWRWYDHASFAGVAAMWLALGILVFLQRGTSRAGPLFLLSASAGAVFLALGTLSRTNLFDAVLYSAGLLLFPAFLFGYARAQVGHRKWHPRELLLYLPPLLLVGPMAEDFVRNQTSLLWRSALLLVPIYLFAALAQVVYDLRRARTSVHAAQARALVFGLVAGTAPGIIIFIIPALVAGYAVVSVTWLPPLVFLFLLAMSYAVLLFEFRDVDMIMRRGSVYGVVSVLIIAGYGAIGLALASGPTAFTNVSGALSFAIVTALVVVGVGPVSRAVHRMVDLLLYGRRVDRWQLLQGLSSRLSTVMQPDELGEVLVSDLSRALHLRGALLLRRTSSGDFIVRAATKVVADDRGRSRAPAQVSLAETAIREALGEPPRPLHLIHAKPLVRAQGEGLDPRYRCLDDLKSALTVPLVTPLGLQAILCLQPKMTHDGFDADDLQLLAPIIDQASTALDNALLVQRLQEKVEELQRAYERITYEQEWERARLAREIHDGTGQELASLITLASVIDLQLGGPEDAIRATVDKLRRQADDAYQEVRRTTHALHPPMLEDFGLVPTIERYADQFQQLNGIRVEVDLDQLGTMEGDVALALFRVVQECLENVRKHSGATYARIELHHRHELVVLTVSDSGRGIPTGEPETPGIGLTGMRERIEAVGGVFRVDSQLPGGVRVEAQIPATALHS